MAPEVHDGVTSSTERLADSMQEAVEEPFDAVVIAPDAQPVTDDVVVEAQPAQAVTVDASTSEDTPPTSPAGRPAPPSGATGLARPWRGEAKRAERAPGV